MESVSSKKEPLSSDCPCYNDQKCRDGRKFSALPNSLEHRLMC